MIEILFNMKTYIKLGITAMNSICPQLSNGVPQTRFQPPRSTKVPWIWGNSICFDIILWKSFANPTVRWCQLHAHSTQSLQWVLEWVDSSSSSEWSVGNKLNAKTLWFNCIECSYEENSEEVRWGRHIFNMFYAQMPTHWIIRFILIFWQLNSIN